MKAKGRAESRKAREAVVINLYTQGGRGNPWDITNKEHITSSVIRFSPFLRKLLLGLVYLIVRCLVLHFLGHRTFGTTIWMDPGI